MNFPKINPTQTTAWNKLKAHFEECASLHLYDEFLENENREQELGFVWDDFFVDFSKQRWSKKTIELFVGLAKELKLEEAIELCFEENRLNFTENRAVLHTALRSSETEIILEDENIVSKINTTKERIKRFSEEVISGHYLGITGKPIKNVLNIGIGGSDLGPKLVASALKQYSNHLNTYFVSNIDFDNLQSLLEGIDPEETLFVVVSKSFTTSETIQNANTIKEWFIQNVSETAIGKHFVAVTANATEVYKFGLNHSNVFPMWDWVGGRFSLWSSVGLTMILGIGYDNYEQLLKGAEEADIHFRNEKLEKNIPVLMAFLSVWYVNFFEADQEAIIPYSEYLKELVPYLQQSFMESNGKNVDRNGKGINYYTCPTIFGGVGCNVQHAFMQLFHQGKHLIPTDFIGYCSQVEYLKSEMHGVLMANMFAQSEALAFGTYKKEVKDPFKIFNGNQPSTTILIKELTPKSFGKLLALYEHKVFVQGILWNINSFDQFGVELGKELSRKINNDINKGELQKTSPLINFYKNI